HYFLVRTSPNTINDTGGASGSLPFNPKIDPVLDGVAITSKGIGGSLGPLTQRIAESGLVPTSNIPLLGDAAPGDVNESTMVETVERKSTDWIGAYVLGGATGSSTKGDKVYVPKGAPTGESFSDGPARWGSSTKAVSLCLGTSQAGGKATTLSQQFAAELGGTIPAPNEANGYYLQDVRDFYAIHGGTQGSCNMLMADGSVKTFYDLNGDKFFNPGFPVGKDPMGAPISMTAQDILEVGYKDATLELPPGEIYSGWSLYKTPKGKFEN